MFPLVQEDDELYVNVDVYIKEKNLFTKTDKKCLCPKNEAGNSGFMGLVQSKKHNNAMKILIFKNNKHSHQKFLCLRCLRIRSSEGGNLSRHFNETCIQSTPHITKNNIYSVLLFSINHYVPLTSLSDVDGKEAFPNFPSYPKLLAMISELKIEIQKNIQKEIQKVKKVTIVCDCWSHPRGIRFLGIVLRYPYDNSIIEAPVELIETPDFTLGSEEMSSMIERQMEKLQIERHKWLSLASDGASDMEKLADTLEIEWDRCIIHLLHLMVQKFWNSALERLQKVHSIASLLHSNSNWNEYMLHHGNEYPNLGKKRNFSIGTDTRWATHLEEIRELVEFEKPILDFLRIKWEKKHKKVLYEENPNKEIIKSDFVMIKEIVPLFNTICQSFKILESKDIYLSKMCITICFIQDEIYDFIKKNNQCCWYDNCLQLIENINNDIFYYKCKFTKNLMASVILDPNIRVIPTQIQSQLKDIFNYIKENINRSNGTPFSPPIKEVDNSMKDPVELKYCQSQNPNYDDELKDWYENVRPYTKQCKNPYSYWKEHQGHKRLKKFAKKLFVHAGSSVACERFFSLCANIADDKRTSMTPDNFSALSIVKANIDRARKILFNIE